MKRIGILGAMPVEINDVVSWLKDITQIVYGMRTCYLGIINDVEAVFFFGKSDVSNHSNSFNI